MALSFSFSKPTDITCPSSVKRPSECFDSDHSKRIVTALHGFRGSSNTSCNVTLEADGQKFEAHKCVLVSMSEYFDKLLNTDMKEKHEETIKITEVSADTLKIVLDFIYTSKISLDEDNVYDVMAAAEYFMLPYLKDFCCTFLLNGQTCETCLTMWRMGRRYNASDLETKSGKFISNNFLEIRKQTDVLELDIDEFQLLLMLKEKNVHKEEDAYMLIVDWVKNNKDEREKFFLKLFSMLNLKQISQMFFSQVILEEEMVKNNETISNDAVQALKSQKIDEHQRQKKIKMYIQPSTSLLVVDSRGLLRKFDVRNSFQELVSTKEFEKFDIAVKMHSCIYLLGCKEKNPKYLRSPSFSFPSNQSNEVFKFDLNAAQEGWKTVQSLPEISKILCATVVKDTFIVAVTNYHVYMYDSTINHWTNVVGNFFQQDKSLVAKGGSALGFPSWKCYDVVKKTWRSFTNACDGVEMGVWCNELMYLFAKPNGRYGAFSLWSSNMKNKPDQVIKMPSMMSVKAACAVNGNVVAVVESNEEGMLLKEFDITRRKWRVITGISDGDFANIFSIE